MISSARLFGFFLFVCTLQRFYIGKWFNFGKCVCVCVKQDARGCVDGSLVEILVNGQLNS